MGLFRETRKLNGRDGIFSQSCQVDRDSKQLICNWTFEESKSGRLWKAQARGSIDNDGNLVTDNLEGPEDLIEMGKDSLRKNSLRK